MRLIFRHLLILLSVRPVQDQLNWIGNRAVRQPYESKQKGIVGSSGPRSAQLDCEQGSPTALLVEAKGNILCIPIILLAN
jgi:hypothetical protein